MGLITMSAHRRKHVSETMSQDEHTTLMANRGELNPLEKTIHDSIAGTFGSHRHVENRHKSKVHGVEPTRATAHFEASAELHYTVLLDPVFVSFADASWANRKEFGSQCQYLCVGTERSLMDGSAAPCCPISWRSRRCPRVARSSGSAEFGSCHACTGRENSSDFCGWKLCKELTTIQ